MTKIEMRKQGLIALLHFYNESVTEVEVKFFETGKYSEKYIHSCSDRLLGMIQMLSDLGLLKAGELGDLYYLIDCFEKHDYESSIIERLLES